ncbi:hypothetical protein [Rhodoplanes sp. Z2-YC6860]|uniref:hypothetical protein n=1 Tax=Rhodoplanes sp. Z2-YC6860 TaxID=674703 RepID=UPI0012ED206A|nr:hypothetical protein [Rhodoplanes sp. Z2-YC6860]
MRNLTSSDLIRAGSALVLSAGILVGTTMTLAAMENAVPKIDVERRCHAAQHTNEKMLGAGSSSQTFEACLKDEKLARDAMERAWAELPASTKALCVQPKVFSASYIEWRECVEMVGHVKALKKR